MNRAFVVYKKGLRFFRDIWDHGMNGFLRWEEARFKFFLPEVYFYFWIKLVEHYDERMRGQYGAKPTSQELVGLYKNT